MTVAWAHGVSAAGGEHGVGGFGWSFEPAIVIPMVLVALLYARGTAQLGRRAKMQRHGEALLFWLGLGILAGALISPMHEAGTQIFTLHMIEHEVLMVVAAPLLVAARPGPVLLWGFPQALRGAITALIQSRAVRTAWRYTSELWSATALHAVVLWMWHAPSLFEPVLQSENVHVVQHVSFLGSALIFWSAIFQCERSYRQGGAVLALFITSLQAGFLGALMTFSKNIWYPFAPDPFPICGLTRGEDQSLAGLIMWIPACSIYVVVALILMARWLTMMRLRRA